MDTLSLKELAIPIIKSIDSFNFLLKSHHKKVATISYHIGKELGLNNDDLLELVVAAALHDIGALSVAERDMLIQEDVENPTPHCIMGYQMLASFTPFRRIAQIIKHHHIKYKDAINNGLDDEIPFQSHIIHLADRVDIYISPDEFILDQEDRIIEQVRSRVGTTFHPAVFEAFEKVAKTDIFWISINDWELEFLFGELDFSMDYELSVDDVVDFSLVLSKIIDFRSRFTRSHSYTVAHLAHLIGGYFGFSEERCKKLMISGYLHDIGKLGVDPGLIEKHGPLTDSEYKIMKLHAYYTGQILHELKKKAWFSEIVTWSENHHEKVDGRGYPYSLAEESLDIGAKILAYSDIISALMETRPYREGLGVDVAFDIIKNKFATSLSSKMFYEIEKHKKEINELVLRCHAHVFKEYDYVLDSVSNDNLDSHETLIHADELMRSWGV